MKTIFATCLALFLSFSLISQEVDQWKILVQEGIALHDKGDYKEALAKYDEALELDEGNASILYEKSSTLFSLKEYDACIKICQMIINGDKAEPYTLQLAYTIYGTAFDVMGKPEEAIKAYNEGLEVFPDYYHLHFNKGITFAQTNKYQEALDVLQSTDKDNFQFSEYQKRILLKSRILLCMKEYERVLSYLKDNINPESIVMQQEAYFQLKRWSDYIALTAHTLDTLINANTIQARQNLLRLSIAYYMTGQEEKLHKIGDLVNKNDKDLSNLIFLLMSSGSEIDYQNLERSLNTNQMQELLNKDREDLTNESR